MLLERNFPVRRRIVSVMRIAVLADIHGNLPAFEAALRHARALSPDLMVICGDIINGGPDSRLCWELAASLGCSLLRGNHERYVALHHHPESPAEWRTDRFLPARWSAAQFSEAEKAALMQMPIALRLPDFPNLLFVHASARDDYDAIISHTPEEKIAPMFPGATEKYIIRGHNHNQGIRPWGEKIIVTVGSIGLPLDHQPSAQYAVLDQTANGWRITHHAVYYDMDAVRQRFQETGYLRDVGPMARLLLREVITACPQVLPFMRWYRVASPDESLPLPEALRRYGDFDTEI